MRTSYSDLNGESVITVPEAEFGTGPKNCMPSTVIWASGTGTTLSTKQTLSVILFDCVNTHFVTTLHQSND
jgi:hypothetical protein